MLQDVKNAGNLPVCIKCKKIFSTFQMLEKHGNRKIPCDNVIRCDRCGKVFKITSSLRRHQMRKTPCDLIQGNPLEKTPVGGCRFCRKTFKSKYNLKNHYNVCKIKNGGMEILFDTIREQQKQINTLLHLAQAPQGQLVQTPQVHLARPPLPPPLQMPQMQLQNGNDNIIAGRDVIKNHFNTTLNVQLIGIGSEEHNEKMLAIFKDVAAEILSAEVLTDVPVHKQMSDRLLSLAEHVYRNPRYKELQGIYVSDAKKDEENVFTYECPSDDDEDGKDAEDDDDDDGRCGDGGINDTLNHSVKESGPNTEYIPICKHREGKWHIGNWDKVSKELMRKMYDCLLDSKVKKYDVLKVMKHIFVLAGFSHSQINLTEENSRQLYHDLGIKLGFDTIVGGEAAHVKADGLCGPNKLLI